MDLVISCLALVFLAVLWLGLSARLRRHHRETAELVAARLVGSSEPRPPSRKAVQVVQALAILAAVEVVAQLTGTSDELHGLLRACRRSEGPFR